MLNLEVIMSDSPGLSDLSEDLNGGHRTSTPNMSKPRRSVSVSAPELKFIKKQIEGELNKNFIFFLNIILLVKFICINQIWRECITK